MIFMQCVFLAAGLGTRMLPIEISKPMIPVANKEFLQWSIDRFDKHEIIVVASENQKDLIEFCKDKYKIVFQKEQLGTADAINSVKDIVTGDFIVANGDCLISKEDALLFNKSNTLSTFNAEKTQNLGIVNDDNTISEKSSGNIINAGIYVFNQDIFKSIEKTEKSSRGEFEITDSINSIIKNGSEFRRVELKEWKTLGHPWDVIEINNYLLEKEGNQISEGAEIKANVEIEGNVAIGNSSIGPNSYIRNGTSIGNSCKIGHAVEIKNSVVMDKTFVSHLTYIGDSFIGRNCNIGGGTLFSNLRPDEKNIIMNINGNKIDTGLRKFGAVLGDNVKTGIGVMFMPGVKISSNITLSPSSTIVNDQTEQKNLKENIGKVI